MRYKNLLRIFLVLVITSFLLTTCGTVPTGTQYTTGTRVVPVEPTKAPEVAVPVDKNNLLVMSWADGDFEQWALETLVDRFNKNNPQYHADLIFVR